jgi:pimeloyl-ACP methyl ester carboxylesterase
MPVFAARPFRVEVEDEVIADLRRRIAATRWPRPAPGPAWSQGTDLDYLREFLSFWGGEFNWTAQQQILNQQHHFEAVLDGVTVHFIHERARSGAGVPLILTHGWPSSFLEYLALTPFLTDPASHGIDGPAFDVVIPSLPGYSFSARPDTVGVNYAYVARLWHQLMDGLGYDLYGAHGGDFGSGVSALMALQAPERVLGLYLTNLEIGPVDPGDRPWTAAEKTFLADRERWDLTERGYSSIQATKPQSLGYGLSDSPAGLAAWLIEKWRSWTDSGGDPVDRLSREFLATLLTIVWATNCITTSMRDYFDNRWHGVELDAQSFVSVPTAVANFNHQFIQEAAPPREWVERLYNVQRWTQMPAGGHFAPVEEPRLVAEDMAAFFGGLIGSRECL